MKLLYTLALGVVFLFLLGVIFPLFWLLIPFYIIGVPFYPIIKRANEIDRERKMK